jgi:hypothetical protein
MAQRRDVTAIQPYKHDLVIGDLYALRTSTEVDKGDCVEISTSPCTMVSTGCGDQKIEVIMSRGNAFADLSHGISIEYVSTTRITREFKLLTHGSVLAKNASSTNSIQPAVRFQSAPTGGITVATAFANVLGRTYIRIPPLRYGPVFVY